MYFLMNPLIKYYETGSADPAVQFTLSFLQRDTSIALSLLVSLFLYLHLTFCVSLSLPPEDGYVRMFIRGRPVTMHIPDQQRESYSLDHKVAQPDRKLKLQWVYPSDFRLHGFFDQLSHKCTDSDFEKYRWKNLPKTASLH